MVGARPTPDLENRCIYGRGVFDIYGWYGYIWISPDTQILADWPPVFAHLCQPRRLDINILWLIYGIKIWEPFRVSLGIF